MDLLEDVGVKVCVTKHGRVYDPANVRDRRTLLEDAEFASGKQSLAIRWAAAATAVRGEPHGRILFGYKRTYDQRTRQLLSQDEEPAEAAGGVGVAGSRSQRLVMAVG